MNPQVLFKVRDTLLRVLRTEPGLYYLDLWYMQRHTNHPAPGPTRGSWDKSAFVHMVHDAAESLHGFRDEFIVEATPDFQANTPPPPMINKIMSMLGRCVHICEVAGHEFENNATPESMKQTIQDWAIPGTEFDSWIELIREYYPALSAPGKNTPDNGPQMAQISTSTGNTTPGAGTPGIPVNEAREGNTATGPAGHFVTRLKSSDAYIHAIQDGTITAPFTWNGTITELADWLLNNDLIMDHSHGVTPTRKWSWADSVFTLPDGSPVTRQRLKNAFHH